MQTITFSEKGGLQIIASANSAATDFDFLVGDWKIRNRKLATRLNGCTEWVEFMAYGTMKKLLLGNANTDSFNTEINGEPFEGMTLRLFDPVTRLWSIYWADSQRGKLDPPVVGSFDGDMGYFYTLDKFGDKDIIMVFCWDARVKDAPVWSQAFSEDKGATWEWNWYMYMTR